MCGGWICQGSLLFFLLEMGWSMFDVLPYGPVYFSSLLFSRHWDGDGLRKPVDLFHAVKKLLDEPKTASILRSGLFPVFGGAVGRSGRSVGRGCCG